ncbi:MAG: hypothetical protein SFW07_04045 [Gammaproteobacteria bacterium]|nr:hypothetical protein [Gammaproteobacteria bacterium]
MVELELFLDETHWNESWLLNEVEISDGSETFSGVITAENFSWVDPKTIRALFTVEASPPILPITTPSVITAHNSDYPDIKKISPSAGTSWPIPDNTEILLSQNCAIGTLYNHVKTDPVRDKNHTEHILRANSKVEFLIDDAVDTLKFTFAQTHLELSDKFLLKNSTGKIISESKELHHRTEQNTEKNIGGSYIQAVQYDFNMSTHTGNINYTAKNITAQTPDYLCLEADVLYFKSPVFIQQCQDESLLNTQKSILESNRNFNLDAAQDLYIIGEKEIILDLNGNSIKILSDEISVTASQITATGQVILSVKPT